MIEILRDPAVIGAAACVFSTAASVVAWEAFVIARAVVRAAAKQDPAHNALDVIASAMDKVQRPPNVKR